jgi:Tfp pilus assembly PilM family ATPase/Tfp pilus assembly protein PilN
MSTNKTARSKKPVVVVEVGEKWLKIIQAAPSQGGVSVSRMLLDKVEGDGQRLSQRIAEFFKSTKLADATVLGVVPRQMVNVRILELPSTDPEEIADMVDLQADKQMPYSRDEIVSNYRILGAGREGYTKVMLVIVQRSVLRQRFALLEGSGVNVDRMSVTTEGILNWCSSRSFPAYGSRSYVVVDVDSYYTDFLVVSDGMLVATRSVLVGGDQLAEDSDEWKGKLAQELRRSLEACRGEEPGLRPTEKLVVCGAGGRFEGLADYLGEQLEMPAETGNALDALRAFPAQPALDDAEYRPVSVSALVGIALDPLALEFDLMPDSVRLRRDLAVKARSLSVLGMTLMAALFAASMYGVLRYMLKKGRLDSLQRARVETASATREAERMQQIVNVVSERRDTRFSVVNLLDDLHPRVPEGVYFDEVDIDRSASVVTLSGTGGTRDAVRALVENLERSPLFRDVTEGSSSIVGRERRLKFQIVCSLEM